MLKFRDTKLNLLNSILIKGRTSKFFRQVGRSAENSECYWRTNPVHKTRLFERKGKAFDQRSRLRQLLQELALQKHAANAVAVANLLLRFSSFQFWMARVWWYADLIWFCILTFLMTISKYCLHRSLFSSTNVPFNFLVTTARCIHKDYANFSFSSIKIMQISPFHP